MIGSIAGDIIGSPFESFPTKSTGFPLFSDGCSFTDDTVLTIAIAHAYFGPLPDDLVSRVRLFLPEEFVRIVDEFSAAYAL